MYVYIYIYDYIFGQDDQRRKPLFKGLPAVPDELETQVEAICKDMEKGEGDPEVFEAGQSVRGRARDREREREREYAWGCRERECERDRERETERAPKK